jgi:hypothetical protein
VEENRPVRAEFGLGQNFPNPFNPTTVFRYQIPKSGYVSLQVFNSMGQRVATLVDGEKPAGLHQVEFDAAHLGAGVYHYRLRMEGFESTKNMVVAK